MSRKNVNLKCQQKMIICLKILQSNQSVTLILIKHSYKETHINRNQMRNNLSN